MHQHPTLTQRTGSTGSTLLRKIATADPEPTECLGGVLDIGWGLFLIVANSFATTSTFRLMRDIGQSIVGANVPGELAWGIPLIAIGSFRLLALFGGRPLIVRAYATACAVGYWFLVWVSLMLANWRSTGTVIYGLLFALTFWCLIRLREARIRPEPEVGHDD